MKLGINVDHIATLRQARRGEEPDPVQAALLAEQAGADFIVVHLREDRRHIQECDVRRLKEVLKVPLNLEMGLDKEIISIALNVRPRRVTIVPEQRQELTTEGGLDVAHNRERLREVMMQFKARGVDVSLFLNPNKADLEIGHALGVLVVELHTDFYANTKGVEEAKKELARLGKAAELAQSLGFYVAAGHGLNYQNVAPIVKITPIVELNIGHSIIAHAAFVGIQEAVREMKKLMARK